LCTGLDLAHLLALCVPFRWDELYHCFEGGIGIRSHFGPVMFHLQNGFRRKLGWGALLLDRNRDRIIANQRLARKLAVGNTHEGGRLSRQRERDVSLVERLAVKRYRPLHFGINLLFAPAANNGREYENQNESK